MVIRKAISSDIENISALIDASVRGLARGIYDVDQIEHSIRSVFGVDSELIADGTYFVVEIDGKLAGCGGWSMRRTLYGASGYGESRDPELLDPQYDAAKIRAFFVHPDAARRGVGTLLLDKCEAEARVHGFTKAEMMSTLPGVPLYAARRYKGDERVQIPVGDGITIECIRMSKDIQTY